MTPLAPKAPRTALLSPGLFPVTAGAVAPRGQAGASSAFPWCPCLEGTPGGWGGGGDSASSGGMPHPPPGGTGQPLSKPQGSWAASEVSVRARCPQSGPPQQWRQRLSSRLFSRPCQRAHSRTNKTSELSPCWQRSSVQGSLLLRPCHPGASWGSQRVGRACPPRPPSPHFLGDLCPGGGCGAQKASVL